jgi:hypothetical protein
MAGRTLLLVINLLALGLETVGLPVQDRETKVRNDREAFEDSKIWIYNDVARGQQVARSTRKPMLIVFRCIPCEACQEFDDEVARRDPIIRDLLDEFVCVRIVQANSMDLSHFQFDFDLSFAVFLTDADLTIYGRFGTRSDRPEWQDISLTGLRKAMAEALRMHRNEADVKPSLAGKQPKPSRFKTPRDYPSLSGRYTAALDYNGKVVQSCVHCHQIREAARQLQYSTGESMPEEMLFPYPDPDVVGLRLDPAEMAKICQVRAGSAAGRAGLERGDELISLDGQPLLSIADFQWVLHNAPETAVMPAQVRRHGKTVNLTMVLKDGWRRGNISWRPTTWDLRRLAFGGMMLGDLTDDQRRQGKLPLDRMALRAIHVGEYGEHALAKRAGLRTDDVVVAFDGKDQRMTESDLLAYVLLRTRRRDQVAVSFMRDGARKTTSIARP